MTTLLEGKQDGRGLRIGIAVARFNQDITGALLEGCLHVLREAGVAEDDLTVAWVPGAFELPLACDRLAASGRHDAVVALGCVIRGGTPHFEYVSAAACDGVMEVNLKHELPVVLGVLTCDDLAQARHRADREVLLGAGAQVPAEREAKETPASNKGAEAAETALEMVHLLRGMA